MVAGYHLIWTVYGYWLPNDPRGSTSSEVRIASIKALGPLHYGRKKQQPVSATIREFHEKARAVLKHCVLPMDDDAIRQIGEIIGQEVVAKEYVTAASSTRTPSSVPL